MHVAVSSICGSPGVSAWSLMLTLAWPGDDPRTRTLVETDVSGGVLAVRYGLEPSPGVVELISGVRQGSAVNEILATAGRHLDEKVWAVPAPPSADGAWPVLIRLGKLGTELASSPELWISDCGRWWPSSPVTGMVESANVNIIVVDAEDTSFMSVRSRVDYFRKFGRVGVLVVGETPRALEELKVNFEADQVWQVPYSRDLADSAGQMLTSSRARRSKVWRQALAITNELRAWPIETRSDGQESENDSKTGRHRAPEVTVAQSLEQSKQAPQGASTVAPVQPTPATVPVPAQVDHPAPAQVNPVPVQADPVPVQADPVPVQADPAPVQADPVPVTQVNPGQLAQNRSTQSQPVPNEAVVPPSLDAVEHRESARAQEVRAQEVRAQEDVPQPNRPTPNVPSPRVGAVNDHRALTGQQNVQQSLAPNLAAGASPVPDGSALDPLNTAPVVNRAAATEMPKQPEPAQPVSGVQSNPGAVSPEVIRRHVLEEPDRNRALSSPLVVNPQQTPQRSSPPPAASVPTNGVQPQHTGPSEATELPTSEPPTVTDMVSPPASAGVPSGEVAMPAPNLGMNPRSESWSPPSEGHTTNADRPAPNTPTVNGPSPRVAVPATVKKSGHPRSAEFLHEGPTLTPLQKSVINPNTGPRVHVDAEDAE